MIIFWDFFSVLFFDRVNFNNEEFSVERERKKSNFLIIIWLKSLWLLTGLGKRIFFYYGFCVIEIGAFLGEKLDEKCGGKSLIGRVE